MHVNPLISLLFHLSVGYDIFGSEKKIRSHLKSLEFQYECGNFESSSGKEVSFVRVTNMSDVIAKTVAQLNESGLLMKKSNIPENVLWALLSGDKGGKSTKLLLQFLNCKEQHSVHTARLLAIFEGDKDNYECIKEVFGPVIEATQNVLANLSELNLKVDLPKCASTCAKANENQVFEIKGMQNWPMELRQLIRNPQSDHCSEHCLYCKKLTGPTCEISTLQSGDGTEMECCISKCWLSLGGDWEFLARLLGLTGPNGTYFCNYCHATIKDLQRGKPHTPWILNSTSNGNHLKQFSPRTFESMSSDNEDFVNGGSVKAKANRFHNCESKPIFRAYGPVIESVSCMPLHLSLGLGKQALEIVENEAIVLDKTIKEANGEACLELAEAFQRRETLNLECLQQCQKLEEINEAISNAEDVLQSFLNETAPFHQKEGRRY